MAKCSSSKDSSHYQLLAVLSFLYSLDDLEA